MVVDGHSVSLLALILLGVVVGMVAGMFGVGGGFLLTPLLAVVLRVPMPIAVGTGLCQMVGTATVALLRHRKLQQGEPRFDLLMIAGSVTGVSAGTRTVVALEAAGDMTIAGSRIPIVTFALYVLFVVFLMGSALALWRRGHKTIETLQYVRRGPLARIRLGPAVDLPRVPLSNVSTLTVAYVGLALGFISGLIGVGGGIALMPILLYGFGFPIRQAAGTGIIVLLTTAVAGTFLHARQGHVHLGMAMVLLVGAGVSAQLGALATSRLPAGLLRRGFVAIIALTMVALAWDLIERVS